MALARAFTSKRAKRTEASIVDPQRSFSVRQPAGKSVKRTLISGPVELVSTTNMLSFNAPDLPSSSSSSNTGDDSDATHAYLSSPATSVGASLIESRPTSPEPNHLSCYFTTDTSTSPSISARKGSLSDDAAPTIPKRVPSHTAASHKALARKRSLQRMSPPVMIPTAQDTISGLKAGDSVHPFGKELEQVAEIAEEYGVATNMLDEEELILRRKGLMKFGVQDYVSEIEDLFGGVFEDSLLPMGTGWI